MSCVEDCYQSVKDRKFESNSQLPADKSFSLCTVISLSKIENLKAIHNFRKLKESPQGTVISLSKIENLKAIHNPRKSRKAHRGTVISLSKIENLKAIHNLFVYVVVFQRLLSVCQR